MLINILKCKQKKTIENLKVKNLIIKIFNQLDLSLNDDGLDQEQFGKAIKELSLATPRTTGNKFFNQLFGGRKAAAVVGERKVYISSTGPTYGCGA